MAHDLLTHSVEQGCRTDYESYTQSVTGHGWKQGNGDRYTSLDDRFAGSPTMNRAVRDRVVSSLNEDLDNDLPTPPIDVPAREGGRSEYHGARSGNEMQDRSGEDRQRTSIQFASHVRLEDGKQPALEERLPKLSISTRPRGRSLLDEIAKKRTGGNDSQRQERSSARSNLSLRQTSVPEEETAHLPPLTSSNKNASPPFDEILTPQENIRDGYASPETYTPMTSSPQSAASSWLSRYSTASRPASFRRRSQRSGTESYQKSPAAMFLRQYSASGASATAPSPDSEGQEQGDYTLGKEIGKGGFSIVRRAFHSSDPYFKTNLAVKIIRKQVRGVSEAENEEMQQLFEREIQLWRCLDHKNILQLIDSFSTSFATFAFMPLAEQGSLFDSVKSMRNVGLDLHVVRNYAAQIAEGLRYLHKDVHVVHRDVKLENCLLLPSRDVDVDCAEMLGPMPRVVLADFGLASYLPNSSALESMVDSNSPEEANAASPTSTESAGPPGSLHYAAPETLHPPKGRQPPLSARPDMWAFGVMLFAMVTGKRPFNDDFDLKLIEAIKAGEWDRALLEEKVKIVTSTTAATESAIRSTLHGERDSEGRVFKYEHECRRGRVGSVGSDGHRTDISCMTGKMSTAGIVGNEAWARSCNTIIVSDGVDPMAISDVVEGCLTNDPAARWDITKVIESAWLARLVSRMQD